MVISQTAASVAMQVMQQGAAAQGLAGGAASTQLAALALVSAESATASQVSANGMIGSIVNTFA